MKQLLRQLTLLAIVGAVPVVPLVSPADLLTDWSAADVIVAVDPVNDPVEPPFLSPTQDIVATYYRTDGVFHYFRMDLLAAPVPGDGAPEYSIQINNAPGGDGHATTNYVAYPLIGIDVMLVSHFSDPVAVWTACHRHFTTSPGVDAAHLETVNVLAGHVHTSNELPGSVFDATEDAGGGPGSMLQWKVAVADLGPVELEDIWGVIHDINYVFGGTFDIALFNPPVPSVEIEKYTNGEDADLPPGPVLLVGQPVTWEFVVTNSGELTLTDIEVTDDQLGLIGTIPSLAPGASTTLEAFGSAVVGQHANVGTVTGTFTFDGSSGTVSDSDPSHYLGEEPEPEPEPEQPGTGTIGYWRNHPAAWPGESIEIGGVTYTNKQAIALMKAKHKGDMSYQMFSQLTAAVLNVAIGNDDSCVESTILQAHAWLVANPVGSGVKGGKPAWKNGGESLHGTLDDYNNGLLCAPHRD